MERDYMYIKGHKIGHGISRKLNVMVESHMMLCDMFKIVKGNFMSLGLVYFQIYSLKLIQGQFNNTEN